jgi:hypothetical protein
MQKPSWPNAGIDFPRASLSAQDHPMSGQRRQFKQGQSLKQRLLERVRRYAEANLLPGAERSYLLQETQESDATADMNRLRRSLGLKPPE